MAKKKRAERLQRESAELSPTPDINIEIKPLSFHGSATITMIQPLTQREYADTVASLSQSESLEDWVLYDTGAESSLWIISDKDKLSSFIPTETRLGTAAADSSPIILTGHGSLGAHNQVWHSPNIVVSVISQGKGWAMGLYYVGSARQPELRDHSCMHSRITGRYIKSRPWFRLQDLMAIPPSYSEPHMFIAPLTVPEDSPQVNETPLVEPPLIEPPLPSPEPVDPLHLLHQRLMHVSEAAIVDAYKHELFIGYSIPRHYLAKKFVHQLCWCDACGRSHSHASQRRVYRARSAHCVRSSGFHQQSISFTFHSSNQLHGYSFKEDLVLSHQGGPEGTRNIQRISRQRARSQQDRYEAFSCRQC